MEFFEFSSDALYPSLNNNELIVQPLETTDSPSVQPTEEIPRSQAETNLPYNSTEFVMENIARTQQTAVPHPVFAVTSSNLNNWVSNSESVSSSVYSAQGMTETFTNYSPSYDYGIRQQTQFPQNMTTTTTYNPDTQEIRPVVAFEAQQYPESQSISRNTNIRLARSRQQNPYFRGVLPTLTLHHTGPPTEGTRHQQQTTFNSPANNTLASNSGQMLLAQTQQHQENFAFVNSIPENYMIRAQQQSGQETLFTSANHSVGVLAMGDGINASLNLANIMPQQSQVQTQSGSSEISETSGMNGLDRSTLPVQQVLHQLLKTIKAPNCTAEQQYQAVRILRSDPRLMAAFLQMKQCSASQHGNMSNISNMTANQHQQQSGAAYRTTPNMTEHMKFPWMMTGGSVRVTSSAVPHYNSYAVGAIQNQDNNQQHNISSQGEMNSSSIYAGYPAHMETGRLNWNNNQPSSSSPTYLPLEMSNAGQEVINKGGLSVITNSASEPGVTAILQLAAARQLMVQASASAAAAGANSLSQTLNDRTLNLDRVMSAHCPSFLHGGRTQMKALLSLTSSANSQLSAPRIPTCSICLDKLVSTILLPCRHFFCETCAPKIEKCGLCRELIENRHQVYF